MPRRSSRNIFPALRGVGADTSGKGAQLSDDIQLTYQLDPFAGVALHGYFGTGVNIIKKAGQLGCIEISVLNPDGILLQAVDTDTRPTSGTAVPVIQFCFVGTRDTPIDMPDGVDLPIFLQGNCSPICTARWGTVDAGDQPAIGQYRQGAWGSAPGLKGFFISFGLFLYIIRVEQNTTRGIAAWWIELNRNQNLNMVPPFQPPPP